MLVTIHEAAQIHNCTVQTIRDWMRAGLPVAKPAQKGGEKHYLESADISHWLIEREIKNRFGNIDLMTADEAKRKKLTAEAALTELELAKKMEQVVDLEVMERQLANKFANLRSILRRIPDRVVMQLVGLTDESKIKNIVLTEIDAALTVLSKVYDESEELDTEE